METYAGGCHRNLVRFEAEIDLNQRVSRCNCTPCTKRGASGLIVKPDAFQLLSGEGHLRDYTRGPGVNHFLFCRNGGIHIFGRGSLPELGGEYVAVNVNCIDDIDPATLEAVYCDGRHDNWGAGPRDEPWSVFDLMVFPRRGGTLASLERA
jgi:hypothetical protein